MSNLNVPEIVELVVKDAFNGIAPFKKIKITDWDNKRIHVNVGNLKFTIRMWDSMEVEIRWTLFIDDSIDNCSKSINEGVTSF